ncbi:TetR/AcrR family transcriptional regulator [Actinophytocola sp.]|uniref:TetR/AcrR family transcriptional regulator n=1 Tax=Actinophytocola sp. TaxID=1872138 RepID=UPI002ED55CFD
MERTGRPRDPLIDDAVRDATVELLTQVGYARLTLEEVARRAGTTKPAIYRRWRTRQHLVLDALGRRLGTNTTRVPDSGCVICDLIGGITVFVTVFRRVPPGVLGALLTDCTGQPGLRTAFMRTLFEPARNAVGEMVDRAKARGDLRADLDRDLAVDLLGALVHYRALFAHASTDSESVTSAVMTLLRGMAARKLDHAH